VRSEEFIALLDNPDKVLDQDISDLKEFSRQYPYSQAGQLLYAIRLRKSSEHLFNQQLGKTSVLTNDRSVLFELFEGNNDLASRDKLDSPAVEDEGYWIKPYKNRPTEPAIIEAKDAQETIPEVERSSPDEIPLRSTTDSEDAVEENDTPAAIPNVEPTAPERQTPKEEEEYTADEGQEAESFSEVLAQKEPSRELHSTEEQPDEQSIRESPSPAGAEEIDESREDQAEEVSHSEAEPPQESPEEVVTEEEARDEEGLPKDERLRAIILKNRAIRKQFSEKKEKSKVQQDSHNQDLEDKRIAWQEERREMRGETEPLHPTTKEQPQQGPVDQPEEEKPAHDAPQKSGSEAEEKNISSPAEQEKEDSGETYFPWEENYKAPVEESVEEEQETPTDAEQAPTVDMPPREEASPAPSSEAQDKPGLDSEEEESSWYEARNSIEESKAREVEISIEPIDEHSTHQEAIPQKAAPVAPMEATDGLAVDEPEEAKDVPESSTQEVETQEETGESRPGESVLAENTFAERPEQTERDEPADSPIEEEPQESTAAAADDDISSRIESIRAKLGQLHQRLHQSNPKPAEGQATEKEDQNAQRAGQQPQDVMEPNDEKATPSETGADRQTEEKPGESFSDTLEGDMYERESESQADPSELQWEPAEETEEEREGRQPAADLPESVAPKETTEPATPVQQGRLQEDALMQEKQSAESKEEQINLEEQWSAEGASEPEEWHSTTPLPDDEWELLDVEALIEDSAHAEEESEPSAIEAQEEESAHSAVKESDARLLEPDPATPEKDATQEQDPAGQSIPMEEQVQDYPEYEEDDDALEDDGAFDEDEVENEDEKDDESFGSYSTEKEEERARPDTQSGIGGSFSSWLKQITDPSYIAPEVPDSAADPDEKQAPSAHSESAAEGDTEDAIDAKMKLLDSFVEKLPVLKKQHMIKVEPIKKPEVDTSDMNSSDIVTETLAKIYIKQGHYKKALKAYQILKLKYPEKSSFFAGRISEIKKLIAN